MINIFVLMGKSGAGKDTVFKWLMSEEGLNVEPIITYTDRPMREGEKDGVNYHFLTDTEFALKIVCGEFIEYKEYNTVSGIWHYGTSIEDLKDGHNYILINTPERVKTMMLRCPKNCVIHPIYIDVYGYTRLYRSLLRLGPTGMINDESVLEVCRRYQKDEEDFKQVLNMKHIKVVHNDGDIKDTIKQVKEYIKSIIEE